MKIALPVGRLSATWCLGLAHFVVLAVLLFPVWLVDIFPTPDYPGHMARIHVLSALESDPILATMYEAQWDFFPNLAMDLFVLAAAKVFPLLVAGKLFISACIVLWMGGTAWLHFSLSRRWSFVPLLAGLFVLNASIFFGFLNFVFSAGVAITGFAAWVTLSSWRLLPRLLCFLPIAVVAYFCHIMGFVILACCVLGFECGLEFAEARFSLSRLLQRLFYATLPLVPVVLIYVFLTPHAGHDVTANFGDIWRSYARVKYATSFSFNRPYILALVFVATIFGLGLITRKIEIDRRMWPVLIGLGLAALLIPTKVIGGALTHIRLPAIIGCLAVASLTIRAGRAPQVIVGTLFAALLLYRAVALSQAWTGFDRNYADLAASIGDVDPGSKMFLALTKGRSRADRDTLTIYSHYLDLVGVQRSIFTPRVYAWPGQHPLRATAAYRPLGATSAYQGKPIEAGDLLVLAEGDPEGTAPRVPYLKKWQCKFDYVVVAHLTDRSNPAPGILVARHAGKFFTLFKIIPKKEQCVSSDDVPTHRPK